MARARPARLDAQLLAARSGQATLGSRYTIVFVPGWLYRSHATTGADFAAPRALLAELRIDHVLAATDENGSIEHKGIGPRLDTTSTAIGLPPGAFEGGFEPSRQSSAGRS